MPAFNHTRRGVMEKTRNRVTLVQTGDFHCKRHGYIGRSSMAVQKHFEDVHGMAFGGIYCDGFENIPSSVENHMNAEGAPA